MRNKLFATAKGVISLSWFIAVLLLFVAVAGVINGVICVAGGYNNSGTLATVEAFTSSTSPLLQSQTYFGGTGNERGYGITIKGSNLYVVGQDGTGAKASLVKYGIPPASPAWSNTQAGSVNYGAVAVSSTSVYAVGGALPPLFGASDGVGGTEQKSAIAIYSPTGTLLGYHSPNFFSYRGVEWYSAVTVVAEGSSEVVYAAGTGQQNGSGQYRTMLAKYSSSGTLLWKRVYGSGDSGGSLTQGLVWLNGYLYIAGRDQNNQAMLLKYDAAAISPDANPNSTGASYLAPVWSRLYNPTGDAWAQAVGTDGANLYVAGYRGSGTYGGDDVFLLKYDEAGTLLWSKEWGGTADDLANGIAVSGNRVYVASQTRSFGAGGADVALLEVDTADGTVLSTQFWGGTADDIARGAQVSGSDIYVVGETASFGAGGTDLVMLRYTVSSLPTATTGSATNVT